MLKHLLGFVGNDRICDWREVLVSIAGPRWYDGKPMFQVVLCLPSIEQNNPAYSSFRLCSRFLSIACVVNIRHIPVNKIFRHVQGILTFMHDRRGLGSMHQGERSGEKYIENINPLGSLEP